MKKEDNVQYSSPFEFEGRIPLKEAIPLGLQHVLAMFVGNLTPLIIIMGACGLTIDAGYGDFRTALLQNAMLVAGIVTLVQLYAIGPIGGKVPIIMGTSSGFLGVMRTCATTLGTGVVSYSIIITACIVGGIFEGVLGFFIKPLRKFFPPVVTGTVVMAIGLSLISVGINYFAGGSGVKDFGSLQNLFLGTFVLVVIVIVKHFCKGIASSSSVLIGIIAGYIVAAIMTAVLPHTGTLVEVVDGVETTTEYTYAWVVNWSSVANASWFALPSFIGFGKLSDIHLTFNSAAIVPMMLMFIVTAVETVGDISGVIEAGMDREATDTELSGGVVCDGLGSAFAALFGVLPNTSFSQNVGLVQMNGVVNRFALSLGAIFLVLCGLCPKLAAIVSIMPQAVLGGAAVMMFSSIVISGFQLICKSPMGGREITIISIALGLGYGLGTNSSALAGLPSFMTYVFGGSGIVPAALIAIVLNAVLPADYKLNAKK